MKKIVFTSLFATTILVGLGMGVTTYATDGDPVAPATTDNTELKSSLNIQFSTDEPIHIGQGPYSETLSLTHVPKKFDFGLVKYHTTGGTFSMNRPSGGRNQYLVVNEDRLKSDENFGKTWNVKVKMSALAETKDGKIVENGSTLTHGKLNLKFNDVQKYNMGTAQDELGDIVPSEPNDEGAVTDFTTKPGYIEIGTKGANNVTINANGDGTEYDILKQTENRTWSDEADATNQLGWATKLSDQSISFASLTKSVVDKEFTGSMTWTLTRDIDAK